MRFIIASAVILFFFYLLYRQRRELSGRKKHLPTYLLSFCAIFLTLSMVRYPQEAFEASVAGLEIWWTIVFPALLPFFVFAQILIGLGVVHMMGVFLEPVMRPVFNVPGSGSFVMAMGLASGFPIGSVLTAELRTRKLCNQVEAERLLSFTNTADPLFMFGAVAVGMMGYPEAGLTIAVAHYLSSISLGLLLRFYRRKEPTSADPQSRRGKIMIRALNALVEAREKDGRLLGQLMGDAIRKSIDTLMLIGGFIILFSVIIRILDLIGVVAFLGRWMVVILGLVGLNTDLSPAIVSGIFEVDLGCQYTALLPDVSYADKVIAVGMIIAWSGLSVHAQVASIISRTDIRIAPYIIARIVHAVLAGTYTALLLGPAGSFFNRVAVPVFFHTVPTGNFSFWWSRTIFMFNQMLLFVGLLLAAAAVFYIVRLARFALFYSRRRL